MQLINKINEYRANKKRKKFRKTLRKKIRKVFNKKNLTKVVIILSGLALIASYTLPYIL